MRAEFLIPGKLKMDWSHLKEKWNRKEKTGTGQIEFVNQFLLRLYGNLRFDRRLAF